ncbi:MAG TPA: hypothetical protein VN831_13115 [Bradyrhizobium sp.]|nr:hypothetical protein [Bradyrhizobium sp.]
MAFREIEPDAVDAIVEVIALGQARFQQFATKKLVHDVTASLQHRRATADRGCSPTTTAAKPR